MGCVSGRCSSQQSRDVCDSSEEIPCTASVPDHGRVIKQQCDSGEHTQHVLISSIIGVCVSLQVDSAEWPQETARGRRHDSRMGCSEWVLLSEPFIRAVLLTSNS